MNAAMKCPHRQSYRDEPAAQGGPAPGAADDWFTAHSDARMGFTLELRPDYWGSGFRLPPDQIKPAAEECFEGLLAFLRFFYSDQHGDPVCGPGYGGPHAHTVETTLPTTLATTVPTTTAGPTTSMTTVATEEGQTRATTPVGTTLALIVEGQATTSLLDVDLEEQNEGVLAEDDDDPGSMALPFIVGFVLAGTLVIAAGAVVAKCIRGRLGRSTAGDLGYAMSDVDEATL